MKEQSDFNSWLSSVLPETTPNGVVAYNFNIAESTTHYMVEIIGSTEYDADDSDWACDESWTCRPETYLLPNERCDFSWERALEYVKSLVAEFISDQSNERVEILRGARAVTVGFVDGDLHLVGPS